MIATRIANVSVILCVEKITVDPGLQIQVPIVVHKVINPYSLQGVLTSFSFHFQCLLLICF